VRVRSLDVVDLPPIQEFHVSDISDILVLAGPNGVGKTRLVENILQAFRRGGPHPNLRMRIEATAPDERQAWGKDLLDTGDATDFQKLTLILQQSRLRSTSNSSVFQFESDRTIQQVQPYTFTWDVADPWLENIGWEFSFNRLRDRFQDTLHSIFRKVRARREAIATRGEENIRRGDMLLSLTEFTDPVESFKAAFKQLLAPKELIDPDVKQQQLHYRYDGQSFPISALSSGEREVVNIVFDTLLRSVAPRRGLPRWL